MASPHTEHLYGLISELNEALRNAYADGIVPFALRVERSVISDWNDCPQIGVGLIAKVAR